MNQIAPIQLQASRLGAKRLKFSWVKWHPFNFKPLVSTWKAWYKDTAAAGVAAASAAAIDATTTNVVVKTMAAAEAAAAAPAAAAAAPAAAPAAARSVSE